MVQLKIQKREGQIVNFDKSKIFNAVLKAMKNGSGIVRENIANAIANEIEAEYIEAGREIVKISEVETLVFNKLIAKKQKLTAKAYEGYRSVREYQRENNTIDTSIEGLVDGSNQFILSENSNKNEFLISTVRDLVAEEVSKDYAKRKMLTPDVVTGINEGIIYVHDLGHYMNKSCNCLPNYTWVDTKKDGKACRSTLSDVCEYFEVVPTEDGTTKEIHEKYYIRDNKGWTRLKAIMARKVKPGEKVYKFKTSDGRSLECTGGHRVPVLRGNKPFLVEAKNIVLFDKLFYVNDYNSEFKYFDLMDLADLTDDITVHDLRHLSKYLEYKYDVSLFTLHKQMNFDCYSHSKWKLYLKDFKRVVERYPIPFEIYSKLQISIKGSKHRFPLVIPYSEDLAKVYAYVYADGGVYVNEEQGTYQLTFTNTNMDLINDFLDCFENVFDDRPNIIQPSGNSPCYRVEIGSRLLTLLFKGYHGANKLNAGDMSAPDFVMNGDRQYKLAYLAAAIDTDGHVSNTGHMNYTTVCEKYANQIKDMVESLGYEASVHYRKSAGTKYDINGVIGNRNYDTYIVSIDKALCSELDSYKVAKKALKKENVSTEGFEKLPTTDIVSIDFVDDVDVVVDLQTESNYYVANDYLVHNCCLVNLKDMLDNGTSINGKLIESPHKFTTACTITTQIVAQVASGQFGGQTITLSHLAPYLRKSKIKIENSLRRQLEGVVDDKTIERLVKDRLQEELTSGVQTFNYQCNTLQTSNGQSPFLSVFMYVEEDPEYEEETAMIIEEFLKQRLQGMKNEVGAWITPAFPKLLYVSTPNNIYEGSKYYYLTELAAKCIAKRMMPDMVSEKQMKLHYEGNVFPCINKPVPLYREV